MKKIAIFDLDGTLLDTVADLGNAANHALRTLGYPEREAEEYKLLCGRGIYNLFRGALPQDAATEENVMKMKDLFLPYYDRHKCDCTAPYGGIMDMMREITEAGVMVALASNKYQDGAEKLMAHFFGGYSFVKILGQREGQPIKPDPAIVEQVLEAAGGIGPEDAIYIGDSDVDMQTGLNAGVRTIGVTWGFRTRKELEAYNPWRICDSPAELAKAILED